MNRLKELREAAILTVHELSELSGVSEDTITKIENGHRAARPSTIRKLATALAIEPQELRRSKEPAELRKVSPEEVTTRPKVEPPLPSFEEDEERRFSEVFELLESWHARRLRQVDDANDAHFRDASAAAMWVADVEEEATDIIDWIVKHGERLVGGWKDLEEITAVGLVAGNPAWLGRERLREVGEPDELSARRLARATAAGDKSRERLGKLVATA